MAQKKTSTSSTKKTARKKPGTTGEGKFYRIELHPGTKYVKYRNQDVGKKGGLERLAGKKASGERDTASRLISKDHAHVSSGGNLIIDSKKEAEIKKNFHGPIRHVKGDVFRANPKTNTKKDSSPSPKKGLGKGK